MGAVIAARVDPMLVMGKTKLIYYGTDQNERLAHSSLCLPFVDSEYMEYGSLYVSTIDSPHGLPQSLEELCLISVWTFAP